MPEWVMILLLTAGPLLWMVGGTWWKPARRFLWPAVAALCLIPAGGARPLVVGLGLVAANSLPYGDKTPWWQRGLTFLAYALPGLAVGGLWWITVPLTGGLLGLYFWLSRKVNGVTWKTWEALAGLLQAISLIVRS